MIHLAVVLCLLIAAAACFMLLAYSGENIYELRGLAAGFFGIVGAIVVIIVGVFYGSFAYGWLASEHKANIINREYGTNYTREEIFYASDVVNVVRELDRKRIEINGDFRRQRDPQRNLRKDEQ